MDLSRGQTIGYTCERSEQYSAAVENRDLTSRTVVVCLRTEVCRRALPQAAPRNVTMRVDGPVVLSGPAREPALQAAPVRSV